MPQSSLREHIHGMSFIVTNGVIVYKHLVDTLKMVAYRSETAMAQMAREKMHRQDDARSLLRALYSTEAGLLPDEDAETLTVRVHHQANRCSDDVFRHLCMELNQTETIIPGTNLRLVL
jgi:hypothetical protein